MTWLKPSGLGTILFGSCTLVVAGLSHSTALGNTITVPATVIVRALGRDTAS
jgi:hypothetical protein